MGLGHSSAVIVFFTGGYFCVNCVWFVLYSLGWISTGTVSWKKLENGWIYDTAFGIECLVNATSAAILLLGLMLYDKTKLSPRNQCCDFRLLLRGFIAWNTASLIFCWTASCVLYIQRGAQYGGRYPYFILNENEYTNHTNTTTESHEKIPTTVVMVAISTIVATLKTLVMYVLYFAHLQYLGEIAADNLRRWGGHDYPRQPETSTGRDFGKESPDPWRPTAPSSESSRRPSTIDYDVGPTRSLDSYRPAGTEREVGFTATEEPPPPGLMPGTASAGPGTAPVPPPMPFPPPPGQGAVPQSTFPPMQPSYPPSQRPEPQPFYPPVPGPPAVPPPGPWPVPQALNYPAVPQAVHQPIPPSNYPAAPSPVHSPAYQPYSPPVQAVPSSYSPPAPPALPSLAYQQSPPMVQAVPSSYSPAAPPALPSPAYQQSPAAVYPAVPQPLPEPPPPPPPVPPPDDSFPRAPRNFKWPPLFIKRS